MNLQCYGYLFGKVKLLKDSHRDEVFTVQGVVVMRNNLWLYPYHELVAIANELAGDK